MCTYFDNMMCYDVILGQENYLLVHDMWKDFMTGPMQNLQLPMVTGIVKLT